MKNQDVVFDAKPLSKKKKNSMVVCCTVISAWLFLEFRRIVLGLGNCITVKTDS